MKTILAVACAALLLSSCGNLRKKEPPPKPFLGTKWVIQLDLPLTGEQPFVRFGDGRMEGFGGCNRIAGRYVQDTVGARALVMGRIDKGTRGCEPSAQLSESHTLEVLQGVSSYTITVDAMTMSGSAGSLKLRSDPPAEVPK